jgi:hypothetical protein
MADADLVKLAARELGELGLADATKVVDGTVVRMPKAYPVYDADYRAHLNVVRSWIDCVPNLHTVGRNGMHKYNNQDHSMLTAMMTVANMRGAQHDVWSVNTDYEYHEEQRIEAATETATESRDGGDGSGGGGAAPGSGGSGGAGTPPTARRAAAPGMRASVGA